VRSDNDGSELGAHTPGFNRNLKPEKTPKSAREFFPVSSVSLKEIFLGIEIRYVYSQAPK